MKKFILLFIATVVSVASYATDFPLRKKYSTVKTISTSALHAEFENVTIIDVLSAFEYDVIKMKNAKNNLVSDMGFIKRLHKMVPDKSTKVVFYCNGITCAKSYKATLAAMSGGYTNVFAYDSGIFQWTKAHPDKAVLLGESPVNPKHIISKKQFQSKLLDKTRFEKGVASEDAFLVDVRDGLQRVKTPKFKKTARKIPFDRLAKELNAEDFMKQISGKTLYVMDAVGKQVRWLQYSLEAKKVNYFFLKNGVWAYFGSKGAVK